MAMLEEFKKVLLIFVKIWPFHLIAECPIRPLRL
jgi:hypothetical protein